jgi:hypothetical protein
MEVDEPGGGGGQGFSSSLPFSFLSERRKLALPPSTAPPKKRYAAFGHHTAAVLRPGPPFTTAGVPQLVGSPLRFLSSPLPPTVPGAPHQCQRQ